MTILSSLKEDHSSIKKLSILLACDKVRAVVKYPCNWDADGCCGIDTKQCVATVLVERGSK